METHKYYMVVHFTEKDGSKGVEWYEIEAREGQIPDPLWVAYFEAMKIKGREIERIVEVDGIQSMQDLSDLIAFGINPKYNVHYHFHLFDGD